MGYYTNFDLTMIPEQNEEREIEIMRHVASKIYDKDTDDITGDMIKWCLSDEMKWYDHNYDMLEISKMFPDITFILYGEGEDHDDLWRAYYRNGEMEVVTARIIFDEPVNPIFLGWKETAE